MQAVYTQHVQTYMWIRWVLLRAHPVLILQRNNGCLIPEDNLHPPKHEAYMWQLTLYSHEEFILGYIAEKRFTHIIQLWHDGSAAPHFKLKKVKYLLWVAQWLQDVHVVADVQLLSWQTDVSTWGEMLPIKTSRHRDTVAGTRKEHRSQSESSSDRLTLSIGCRVMGLARSVQWATRASGVMSRPYVLSVERKLWLVSLYKRKPIPALLNLYNHKMVPVGSNIKTVSNTVCGTYRLI